MEGQSKKIPKRRSKTLVPNAPSRTIKAYDTARQGGFGELRRLCVGALLLTVCHLRAPAAHAGIYNPADPAEGRISPYYYDFAGSKNEAPVKGFRQDFLHLRAVGLEKIPVDNPLRRRAWMLSDLAKGGAIPSSASVEQRLSISAALLRTRRVSDAIQILEPLARREPDNFLVLANLATAYQLVGQDLRARDMFKETLRHWPARYEDVKPDHQKLLNALDIHEGSFYFVRKAEALHAKLNDLRYREKVRKLPTDTLDDLFGDDAPVKYVGPSGKFEPGKIDPTEKRKLPRDAMDLVQQLLIWMPDDPRLFWQLAELYNARGEKADVLAAREIYNDLWEQYLFKPKELGERRIALQEYVETLREAEQADLEKNLKDGKKDGPPVSGAFDMSSFLVGLGLGVIVGIFAIWQIREWKRRLFGSSGKSNSLPSNDPPGTNDDVINPRRRR